MKGKKREEEAPEAAGEARRDKPSAANGLEARPASFEEAFAVVEGSVERLERGNLSLEDALREYERGLRALKGCYQVLETAQKRIEVLAGEVGIVAEGAEGPFWKPAASHPALREAVEHVEREEETPAGE